MSKTNVLFQTWIAALPASLITILAAVTLSFSGNSIAGDKHGSVFKSGTEVARVDVVVLDNKTQKPVTGLNAQDFTIVENGVPQTLSALCGGARLHTDVPQFRSSAEPQTDSENRTFLFVIGRGHMEGPVHPFEGVTEFLTARLRPNDSAAWTGSTVL